MKTTAKPDSQEVENFIRILRRDAAGVRATSAGESEEKTEDQVSWLKVFKRQIYERAKVDLLSGNECPMKFGLRSQLSAVFVGCTKLVTSTLTEPAFTIIRISNNNSSSVANA